MKEFVVHNVDFIQLTVNPGDARVYFPTSTHLQGKKILSMEFLANDAIGPGSVYGLDLSNRFPIIYSSSIYVTLYDIDGNLIVDSLFFGYLTTSFGAEFPVIDLVIDWERSFITVSDPVQQTSVIFFSVYLGEKNSVNPVQRNLYNLPISISPDQLEYSLYRKVQALEGRKITGVYYLENRGNGIPDKALYQEFGYLYLVPKDKSRYINYIPLQFISGLNFTSIYNNYRSVSLQQKFIEPVEIDFNRSKILIRSTCTDIRTLNLSFYYE